MSEHLKKSAFSLLFTTRTQIKIIYAELFQKANQLKLIESIENITSLVKSIWNF
ncbi:hypothetical protein LEP1GSC059_1382 [Leptospira noguchii serovar Panama str. CZ214]|uniref:Uncharacterized protein n=1 Tax=Leptospira noguchii serovar Panama str. CZ214 TaxID=1001595 RepID=T0FH38_9LEPT|nr:hypothetical protein LEP1GSC059_1382 [Leptospira noguchii serovar Panama str. CZ214]